MRKPTICLFLILCSLAAFGQKQPQWKVVKHLIRTNQLSQIPETAIFTPTKPGLYRLSAYLSVADALYVVRNLQFNWTDAAGEPANVSINATNSKCSATYCSFSNINSYVFIPQAGIPVSYLVYSEGNLAIPFLPPGSYNIAFTIEQLQK
jgi:hypothetical protein